MIILKIYCFLLNNILIYLNNILTKINIPKHHISVPTYTVGDIKNISEHQQTTQPHSSDYASCMSAATISIGTTRPTSDTIHTTYGPTGMLSTSVMPSTSSVNISTQTAEEPLKVIPFPITN